MNDEHPTHGAPADRDMVNHPAHYNKGPVECLDAIESAVMGLRGIEAVYAAHVIRYVWRYPMKNGLEDLKKAEFYLQRLIREVEGQA